MPTIAEALALGKQCQKAGDLGRAEQVYRQILAAAPDQADVWFALGITYQLQKKLAEASAAYENALRLRPDCAEIYYNLGHALKEQGRSEAALASFAQAVRWNPNFADAHYELGIALADRKQREEAMRHFQQAVQSRPNFVQAWSKLGICLAQQEQLDAAEACFRRVLVIQPENADAANDLGNVLSTRGRPEEAIASYREALRHRPNAGETYHNLASMLTTLGKPKEAMACYEEVLRLMRVRADVYYNDIGIFFWSHGHLDEAIGCLRQAMRICPDNPEFAGNLGRAYMEQGRFADALTEFRRVLAVRPDSDRTLSNYLICLNYDAKSDPDYIFSEHRRVASLMVRDPPLPQSYDGARHAERRLRVGYVSPDFGFRAAAYFLEGILRNHDSQKVEAFGYAEVPTPDANTERLRTLLHGWRSTCGLSNRQVAELVRADQIDILIDLAGHVNGNRLLAVAYKPAPVQVTYLGYPNTTGLTAIDYRLTDAITDPPGEPVRHTEELVRLEGGFACYTPPDDAPEVTLLPALQAGHVTFGAPHFIGKLNDHVVDLWCAILRDVPGSRLLGFRRQMFGETREQLQRKFLERGMPPERVELRRGAHAKRDYLSTYGEVDLFLDAFPYTGHTTICESLWMGVPVVTLRGERFASRAGASVLVHAGLPELVANSTEEYRALAVQLASDLERLARMRAEMRNKLLASPLLDCKAFTRRLEETYRWMWRRWLARA